MTRGSTEIFRVRTPRQLRIIGDPVRNAIFEAMCDLAPCGVAEIAARLGRSAESLHYHLRQLVGIGLVKAVGEAPTGGRRKTVYDLTARVVKLDPPRPSRAFQQAKADSAAHWLRLTERQLRRAIEAETRRPAPAHEDQRDVRIMRELVSLSDRDLARLNRLLEQIHDLCGEADTEGAPHRVAVTIALCPEAP